MHKKTAYVSVHTKCDHLDSLLSAAVTDVQPLAIIPGSRGRAETAASRLCGAAEQGADAASARGVAAEASVGPGDKELYPETLAGCPAGLAHPC